MSSADLQEKKKLEEESPTGSQRSLLHNGRVKHSPFNIIAIIGACLMFAFVLFLNYFNTAADGAVFNSTIGETSDFFYFEITPAGWAFSIWGLIYFWQAAFLIYGVVSIFRKTSHGPLYVAPPNVPVWAYLFYSLNLAINIGWLFSFDRKIIILSLFFLAAIPATLIGCLVSSFIYNSRIVQFFKSEEQRYEMILLNIFVYNGWAVYLGWTVCASLLNFGFVLVYSAGVSQEASGIVALTVLLVMILVFCPLELTILDKYLRYVVMHYLGPIMALSGSISKAGSNNKGYVPSGLNRTYAAVILGILLLFCVAKSINLGIRAWKQPLYYDNGCSSSSSSSPEKNGPPESA